MADIVVNWPVCVNTAQQTQVVLLVRAVLCYKWTIRTVNLYLYICKVIHIYNCNASPQQIILNQSQNIILDSRWSRHLTVNDTQMMTLPPCYATASTECSEVHVHSETYHYSFFKNYDFNTLNAYLSVSEYVYIHADLFHPCQSLKNNLQLKNDQKSHCIIKCLTENIINSSQLQ